MGENRNESGLLLDSEIQKISDLVESLKKLSLIDSLSGEESFIREKLSTDLKSLGYKCSVDEKGNLWAKSDHEKQGGIMLCAHMDKVGAGKEIVRNGDLVTGRLDDAVGLSAIIQVVKDGFRPSILFTVKEEAVIESKDKDGNSSYGLRQELIDGTDYFNAGARFVAELFDKKVKKEAEEDDDETRVKPNLIVIVDVTQLGKVGNGPLIYTSSGLKEGGPTSYLLAGEERKKDFLRFDFSHNILKNVARIVNRNDIKGVSYVEGNANDSIEFTFVEGLGVIAVEVPVKNNHTDHEKANLKDILKVTRILEVILQNADKISKIEAKGNESSEEK